MPPSLARRVAHRLPLLDLGEPVCRTLSALFALAGIIAAFAAVDPSARAATAAVDATSVRQTIRGFGGATVFRPTTPLEAADLDALYGTANGQIGLSLLRIRVAPDADWRVLELANAIGARARGASVIASPWSPPATMKNNNDSIGGSLLPSFYAAYAAYLNDFAQYMADHGAPLYAISIQNEPDIEVTYESCDWTAAQLLEFCKNHAGTITATRVMMPESFQFAHALSDPTLNDAQAAANVDLIGGHIYGAGLAPYPLAVAKGKEVWMTEHLELTTDWAGALTTAKEIHDCLAVASFNAYLWWYLKRYYGPLGEDGVVTKRGHVMAQFSRFVRPGFVRIDATASPAANIYVSAYKGSKLVIVAINRGTAAAAQAISVQGTTVTSVTPWVTSATLDQAAQPALAVTGGAFTATLPAESVTTFVGDLVGAAPFITAQPVGHVIAAGGTIVLEVAASGASLTYQWRHDGIAIPGATNRRLALTNLQSGAAGNYAVTVSNPAGSATSELAAVSVIATDSPGRLINISTRSPVGTGAAVEIAGFVIAGTEPRPVLIRAAGPALNTAFGLAGCLADPMFDLYRMSTNTIMATIDDWDPALAPTFARLGAFAWTPGSRDSALLTTLDPGIYTVLVRGKADGTGNALVEVYDAGTGVGDSRLVNISTRSFVGIGDGVQIAGFVVAGTTARTVVIRAAGPALNVAFGLGGCLADPVFDLHKMSTGTVMATADDWDPDLSAHFAAVGAFPWTPGSKDAATVVTLDPGIYSVVVRGVSNSTGITLVEVYAEP